MSTKGAVDFRFLFASACTVSVAETDNSMAPRVVDCIALLQVDNPEGTSLFLCLSSGKIIKRNHFKVRPMPSAIITYLNNLAFKEGRTPDNRKSLLNSLPIAPVRSDPKTTAPEGYFVPPLASVGSYDQIVGLSSHVDPMGAVPVEIPLSSRPLDSPSYFEGPPPSSVLGSSSPSGEIGGVAEKNRVVSPDTSSSTSAPVSVPVPLSLVEGEQFQSAVTLPVPGPDSQMAIPPSTSITRGGLQVLESFRVGVDHSSLVSADRFDISNTLAR
jgi:hypothetical protein